MLASLRFLLRALSLSLCAVLVFGATYSQKESHSGQDFLKSFSFETMSDPTHGRVQVFFNYVDANTAARQNLTFAKGDHFVVRADYEKTLKSNGPGRDSVRLRSNKQYTTSVMVFNMRHMPEGCGTWPAVWTVGGDWPTKGEIDILEGVNDKTPNQATLHTNNGCTMPASRSQTGKPVENNCDVVATKNVGCGVKLSDTRSYGPTFNQNGGGWYALEHVRNGAQSVNTDSWGTPSAYFPSNSCSISSHFGPHNIIINLTFCGDWAGSVYGSSGCPSTCDNYVNNNPSAFRNAYFDFQWLKIYG